MRLLGLLVAAAVPALAACTSPNPAWNLTDSEPLDTASAGPETASSTSGPAITTTDPVTATSVSTSPTLDPETTDATGAPATTGPATTTGPVMCAVSDGPDLALSIATDQPAPCNPTLPRQFHAEVLGQAGSNQWKFNVCTSPPDCLNPQAACEPGEHVILNFDGPAELVPAFAAGQCHEIVALARDFDENAPPVCALRLLRIAHTRFAPYAIHYVGAVDVPTTDALPEAVDWPFVLGFTVAADLHQACEGGMDCDLAPGLYQLVVLWGQAAVEHVVLEGASFLEAVMVADTNQVLKEMTGTFTDLRSHVDLAACEVARDFKWVWRADVPQP